MPSFRGQGQLLFLPDVTFTSPSMARRLVEELRVDTRIICNELVPTYQTIRCHIPKYRQSDVKNPYFFSSHVRQNIGINFNSSILVKPSNTTKYVSLLAFITDFGS